MVAAFKLLVVEHGVGAFILLAIVRVEMAHPHV
jgi:hypothetical protein